MAPDPASAKAGQGLSSPRKWISLGRSDRTLWGECQGSGASPYQVAIDLSEPAFKCSCPSRKFPCKHGIGLLLIYTADASSLASGEPPGWVAAWLAKRDEKAEKQAIPAAAPPVKAEAVAQEPSKQALRREARVKEGIDSLALWLRDVVTHGFTALAARPYSFYDDAAARLVDSQAPGLARMVRQMAALPASGEGWQDRALQSIGLIQLLMQAYRSLSTLALETQADVRAAIGWTVKQEEVLQTEPVSDVWTVAGIRIHQEDRLTVRRTWLIGHRTGRYALLLAFIGPGQKEEAVLPLGSTLVADLCFFPGAWPQRALIKERGASTPKTEAAAYPDSEAMLKAYADALAANPWLEQFPVLIDQVVPVYESGRGYLLDSGRNVLPIAREFGSIWKLLALSGGTPMQLFGEWDGANLLPLGIRWNGHIVNLL
jgi:hypothetical protein